MASTLTTFTAPIHAYLADASALIAALSAEQTAAAASLLLAAWRRRARVYVCGNGGSAAIASHFAGDLNKGANVAGRHRFRAIALVDNVPALTAWSNDDGYAVAMAEQLRNFIEPGDLVIGISGSGNSANVVSALALARQAGANTLSLCGFDGGQIARPELSDVTIHVPSHSMEQVEDAFSVLCHCLLYTLRRQIRLEPPCADPLLASAQDAYPSEQ
ncbi:MAG TPA: SIS domain-containing protein [Anaerolineae bacterium]|nr:SIS domain-containing protein [Anaerolineae bacterium]